MSMFLAGRLKQVRNPPARGKAMLVAGLLFRYTIYLRSRRHISSDTVAMRAPMREGTCHTRIAYRLPKDTL